eukprot:3677977-Ditylum_brightwellii.AAC.1
MQNKLKERTDFQLSVYNDPINLLRAIKQNSQDFQDQRYEVSTIFGLLVNMVTLKQKENEVLQDYTS